MAAVADHAELLKALGASVMVYGECAMMAPGSPLDAPMSHRLLMPKTDVAGYAARLTEFGRRLKGEYGLTLAYHHHLMMVAETFDEVSRLFDATGRDAGLLLDTGHAHAGGFDYAKLIERFGDRIVHIHLKDVRDAVIAEVRKSDRSFNERRARRHVHGSGRRAGSISRRSPTSYADPAIAAGWSSRPSRTRPQRRPSRRSPAPSSTSRNFSAPRADALEEPPP